MNMVPFGAVALPSPGVMVSISTPILAPCSGAVSAAGSTLPAVRLSAPSADVLSCLSLYGSLQGREISVSYSYYTIILPPPTFKVKPRFQAVNYFYRTTWHYILLMQISYEWKRKRIWHWYITYMYSSVPVSHDSVMVRQHAQCQDPKTEAVKWNYDNIRFIIYSLPISEN